MTETPVQPLGNTSAPPVVPTEPAVSVPSASPTPPANPSSGNKRKFSPQIMLAALGLLILVIGAGVGFFLMNQSQEIRQQAAGYASCAGGVPHNGLACSGFRQPVRCVNGSFETLTACTSSQRCDSGLCVNTERDCAGGVKHGQTACSGLRTQVTCNDGSFVNETPCANNETCQSGRCGGGPAGTSSPTPRPSVSPQPSASPGNGTCRGIGESCDDGANSCCGGGVCQGVGGNRICQVQQDTCNDPDSNNDGVCGGNQGWLGFRCNNLSNGQCLENPQTFNSYNDAYNYASTNGCGQVDEVCVGGWKNRDLCGSFQIIATNCGGSVPTPQPSPRPTPRPTPTPGVTPSPEPSPSPGVSPSPGPICAYVAINKPNVVVGDQINLTCGIIPGVSRYEFRISLPDGSIQAIQPASENSNISANFAITQTGAHKAQCRICTGNACQEWETL